MELSIYFSNLNRLENIEEALYPIKRGELSPFINDALFGKSNFLESLEYYNNLVSLENLQTYLSQEIKFSRVYFGQEFCEYLIPTLDELSKAYYISQQLGWDFTYVTGYLTNQGIEKVRKNLGFLISKGKAIEVVVNDWGLLAVINREFSGLRPVLGRLLIKQKRLERFPFASPPINMQGIDTSFEEVARNQRGALRRLNLSIANYREELKRLGVERIEVDIVPQGVDVEPHSWHILISCYYPWAYVTGGRNCSTAAIDNSIREYVVIDELCLRPCQRLNRASYVNQFFVFPTPILQRGNAVFAFTHDYARPYVTGEIPIDRLIFQPYIPI